MTSSAIPSAKNSCSGSALIFVNGNTVTDGLSGKGNAAGGSIGGGADPRAATRKTCTISAIFLTCLRRASVNAATARVPTCSCTAVETQMPPGLASACRRAAILTASPQQIAALAHHIAEMEAD